eukprot:gnl/TRDRNA2_/TRDRNA2_40344_c0_seq1.p1 gnl/TRDRNA2_/TRDRNA2_40344_c0~~gnl/TRDRNA2_/TRDRNA2_40344_c0_seq1.p1  ORF type:complete len:363 (+),score=74.77 gnl/TRDRNA2_/TRDRNA2_40344_c0_seq1:74-1162(+)
MWRFAITLFLLDAAAASNLRHHDITVSGTARRNSTASGGSFNSSIFPHITFQQWYSAHTTGRGLWKWNTAIAAYDRHFGPWAGRSLKLAEVGVESGGSVMMWQGVLGIQCHVYGLDIKPQTMQFANARTTITVGDQEDPNMWRNFFTYTVKGSTLDILVDDGGHEAQQMITTLKETIWHMNPGGYVAIEGIHGEHYVDSFFVPAAQELAQVAASGELEAVHVYPFLLVAERAGEVGGRPPSTATFSGKHTVVDSFNSMWAAVKKSPGGTVILKNAGWGPFLTADGLSNFFRHFGQLHRSNWYDSPQGCLKTSAALCSTIVIDSDMQAWVTGYHIYNDRLVVEVAPTKALIKAVRKGTRWLQD